MKLVVFALFILFSTSSSAVKVAFFKSYDQRGNLIKFEGSFSHVAISYKDKWLHAHPYYGVSLTHSLYSLGSDFTIIESQQISEPNEFFIKKELEKKFNIFASWNSATETYCSKLVGKYFKIKPSPMKFKSKNWRRTNFQRSKGSLGMSPTDIYQRLLSRYNFSLIFKSIPEATSLTCKRLL